MPVPGVAFGEDGGGFVGERRDSIEFLMRAIPLEQRGGELGRGDLFETP